MICWDVFLSHWRSSSCIISCETSVLPSVSYGESTKKDQLKSLNAGFVCSITEIRDFDRQWWSASSGDLKTEESFKCHLLYICHPNTVTGMGWLKVCTAPLPGLYADKKVLLSCSSVGVESVWERIICADMLWLAQMYVFLLDAVRNTAEFGWNCVLPLHSN